MNTSQYFYRVAVYSLRNQQVSLIDLNNPGTPSPLDNWLASIVALADGQHTIKEFIALMKSQYLTGVPANLVETIESALVRLGNTEVIRFADQSVKLPYYFEVPYERLDLEKAKSMMLQDGHL